MSGHHIDAEFATGLDHILTVCPQGGGRTLPGVAAIEQQRIGPTGTQLFDQRRQMRVAANPAVALRGAHKIEMRVGMRFGTAGGDGKLFQQRCADQMRRLTARSPGAEISRGLTKPDRQQLRMTVSEMQQMDVTEARHLVKIGSRHLRCPRPTGQRQTGGRSHRHDVQKLSFIHAGIYP